MNFLFYCAGDDGSMLQALRDALHNNSRDNEVFDSTDASCPFDRASITAAICWQPPEDFFKGLINLTHVYALAAGVDQLLEHPGLPKSVTVVRLRDAGMADQMAEYVLYGVLRAQRQFHEFEIAQREAKWIHGVQVHSAATTSVGILGAGVLATAVATRLQHNGYPVCCWSRSKKTSRIGASVQLDNQAADQSHRKSIADISHAHGQEQLPEFLNNSRVLVCLLALTDSTRGILNKALFAKLPKGSFVINCARGQHLNDADLLNALDEKHLSGAMLDVFEHEPLQTEHAFWTHPRVLVTPHEAARSLPEESIAQVLVSIEQVKNGKNPEGLVDRLRGY